MITAPTIEETYTAYGNISRLFTYTGQEVILGGPAGTGKSRGNLEYLNYWAMEYPGCRLLMVRKTRRSLTESGMVTLEQKVLHPAQGVYFSSSKQQYQYPNGSIIAVAGLDKPSKIMSSEWDIIYPQEATELEEDDWEMCSIRLRNGRLPVQQMIGDCNPGPSTHWIKQRANAKRLLMLETRHEDNPVLYDRHGVMTAEGERYLGRLDQLTGVRYARYRKGLWVSAEGMVYEESWDARRNVINRSVVSNRPRDLMGDCGLPASWPRYMVIDFGFNHPFVCLWVAVDDDGRLYVYRQIYKTKTIVEDHAKEIKRVSRWGQPGGDPLPREIICDHDAEDRATLERHLGLMTMPAYKSVSDGIQAVASRFRPAGDGKPRLMILLDSLVERDRDLAADKKPTCTEEEPEGYIWDTRQGMKKGEHPVKDEDDGCFVAGTMIATERGDVPIERIAAGDYVLTRNGYKRVKAAGMTAQWANVHTVCFTNGAELTGTGNHPIYLRDKGYIPLRALRYGDTIEDINSYEERYPLCQGSLQQSQRPLFTKGSLLGAIPTHQIGATRVTTVPVPAILRQVSSRFIRKYGKMPMGLFQRGTKFTIGTAIRSTTHWKIWNALHQRHTPNTMPRTSQKGEWRNCGKGWIVPELLLARGIDQKRGGHGTVLSLLCHGRMQSIVTTIASNAVKGINQEKRRRITVGSAPMLVNQRGDVAPGLITKHASVDTAIRNSFATSTQLRHSVPLDARQGRGSLTLLRNRDHVQFVMERSAQEEAAPRNTAQEHAQAVAVSSISKNKALQPVYNLTVDNPIGEGEYFANGVLVHNCDCLRYITARFDLRPTDVTYSSRIY